MGFLCAFYDAHAVIEDNFMCSNNWLGNTHDTNPRCRRTAAFGLRAIACSCAGGVGVAGLGCVVAFRLPPGVLAAAVRPGLS